MEDPTLQGLSEELKTRLEGLKASIQGFTEEAEHQKVTLGSLETHKAAVDEKLSGIETWMREMEGKLTTAKPESYLGNESDLLAAIPEHDRKQCALAEMSGHKSPVRAAATALMLQKTIAVMGTGPHLGARERERGIQLNTELDNLKKAFGPALVTHASLAEGTAGLGAEVILTPVESMISRIIHDNSQIRQVARVIPMVSKEHKIPNLATEIAVTIEGEAATIDDSVSAGTFTQGDLTAKKIAGIATVSNELLQDNAIGLQDLIFTMMGEKVGRTEDIQALEGDGTGVNYTGIVAASGVNSIAAGTNGDAPTFQAKVARAVFAASHAATRESGAWFMAPELAGSVLGMEDSQGRAVFQGAIAGQETRFTPQARGLLWGYPAFIHSGIRADRTKGTGTNLSNLYFGNWKHLWIGDLLGLTFATDPFGLFTTDEVRLRVTKRTAILVQQGAAFTKVLDLTTT